MDRTARCAQIRLTSPDDVHPETYRREHGATARQSPGAGYVVRSASFLKQMYDVASTEPPHSGEVATGSPRLSGGDAMRCRPQHRMKSPMFTHNPAGPIGRTS